MRLCAILLVAAALPGQVVEVTVVETPGGAPLPGVTVELAQNGYWMQRGITNTQGTYRFDSVPAGEYSVEYAMAGYRRADRGAAASRPIHVAEGGTPIHVDLRLMRLGQLSGTVTGARKPVAAADVQLFLAGNFIGQIVRTDAKGEFHFRDVDPGTYILSARATKGSASPPAEEDGRKMGWVRTWYPSSPDASGAARVLVAGGADVSGQDIALLEVPVHRVSGRVLSTKGEPMRGVAVKAAPPEEFATAEFEMAAQSKEDGGFEIDGLSDGNWRFTAESRAEGMDLYAARVETVTGHDIERLELRFVPPFTLAGRVVRTATGTPAGRKTVGVMLAPREGGYRMTTAMTREDGSFQLENVAQGVYRFQPTSPGAPYYLASIEMNGRDVTGQYVEIVPGTLPVTITYRSDGGTVRGTVEECGGATVVLAPREAPLQYAEFVRQTKCGQGGHFEIANVRPGEYYAFAFDQPVGMLEYSSFAARWLNQAVRVSVRPGEATDAPLKVTQRGTY